MAGTIDLYPSRTATPRDFINRVEPVVYKRGTYAQALTAEQVAAYDRDGFIVINDLFEAAEVDRYLSELHRLLNDPKLQQRAEAIKEPNSDAVRSLFSVHEFSSLLAHVVNDPRVVEVAKQILGSEVYVHQSRANIKPGFTGEAFYWHSDFETWHVEDGMPSMRALSCSILLTDNDATNGPLMLVPGSQRYFVPCLGETPDEHHKQSLKNQQFGVPSHEHITELVDRFGLQAIEAKAGSVIFFDCNTLHGSANNISPGPRSNIFTVYNSVENVLNPPKYGLAERPSYLAYRGKIQAV